MSFDDLFAVSFEISVNNPEEWDYDLPQAFIDE